MTKNTKDAKSKKEIIEKTKPTLSKKSDKKTTEKKSTIKVNSTKVNTSKKSTEFKKVKKDSTEKNNLPKKKKTSFPENFSAIEYYDLPENYSKTVVKLLAQTPNTLFVYWDISNNDKQKYIEQYGSNFFEITKPVLIVHNDSMNYSFEVDINDFANCWYLNVNDSKCQYRIELGRRPINNYINSSKIDTNYVYISSSNEIEAPNDHILFDNNQKMVYFKNVKNNKIDSKSINISYIKNIGKIYNIYDMYKQIYKDENVESFDLSNPSSK